VADSLKLAIASLVLSVAAATGGVARLPWPSADTAAFLLYFTWPLLSVVLLCLTGFFAARDLEAARKWQGVLALLISGAVVGVTFARFHGWE